MTKPILCLDFDGVLHSYTSGWQGATTVADPPVDGALKFLVHALEAFEVHIYSSRSHQFGGVRAMNQWLFDSFVDLGINPEIPDWWRDFILNHPEIRHMRHASEWGREVRQAAHIVLGQIKWPKQKPSAMVTIDDRAITFTGEWPVIGDLLNFKPWNKK